MDALTAQSIIQRLVGAGALADQADQARHDLESAQSVWENSVDDRPGFAGAMWRGGAGLVAAAPTTIVTAPLGGIGLWGKGALALRSLAPWAARAVTGVAAMQPQAILDAAHAAEDHGFGVGAATYLSDSTVGAISGRVGASRLFAGLADAGTVASGGVAAATAATARTAAATGQVLRGLATAAGVNAGQGVGLDLAHRGIAVADGENPHALDAGQVGPSLAVSGLLGGASGAFYHGLGEAAGAAWRGIGAAVADMRGRAHGAAPAEGGPAAGRGSVATNAGGGAAMAARPAADDSGVAGGRESSPEPIGVPAVGQRVEPVENGKALPTAKGEETVANAHTPVEAAESATPTARGAEAAVAKERAPLEAAGSIAPFARSGEAAAPERSAIPDAERVPPLDTGAERVALARETTEERPAAVDAAAEHAPTGTAAAESAARPADLEALGNTRRLLAIGAALDGLKADHLHPPAIEALVDAHARAEGIPYLTIPKEVFDRYCARSGVDPAAARQLITPETANRQATDGDVTMRTGRFFSSIGRGAELRAWGWRFP